MLKKGPSLTEKPSITVLSNVIKIFDQPMWLIVIRRFTFLLKSFPHKWRLKLL